MSAPNPQDHPELYDVITVAGATSPGTVTLSGHDRTIGWDIKKGKGQAGATTTRTSEDPVEFTATFFLVRDDAIDVNDHELWPAFADVLRSSVSGKAPKALDIYHPDLAANEIKSVVLKSMGGWTHDGKGGVTVAVKLLEYRPPKPKGGSPNGSKPNASKNKAKDPNQDLQDEIARLTQKYQNTPAG